MAELQPIIVRHHMGMYELFRPLAADSLSIQVFICVDSVVMADDKVVAT